MTLRFLDRTLQHVSARGMESGLDARALWAGAPRAERNRRGVFALVAVGLTLLALALRLYRIDQESIWHDEAYTLLMARMPLDRLIAFSGSHEHPPVLYLLVHGIFAVHDSYLVPRYVSAVAGSLSVIVLYALGSRLFGPIAGITASALLAVAPFHIWHSQNGRAHELAGLLVLLSYLCVFTALRKPRLSVWLGYVAATTLALYTDYVSIPVLIPQVLLMLRARRAGLTKPLLACWAGVLVAFLPWIAAFAFGNAVRVAEKFWIPPPTLMSFVNTVLEFLGMRTTCPSATPCTPRQVPLPPGGGVAITVVTVAAVLAWMVLAVRSRHLTLAVLLAWLTFPFALVLIIATVRSLYLDRYFLLATFPLYLLLGFAVLSASGRRRLLLVVLTAVALIEFASAYDVGMMYAKPGNPDWRLAVRYLVASYRPGQAVAFYPGLLQTLTGAYLPRTWSPTRERAIWLRTYLDVPGWQTRYARLTDRQLRSLQLADLTGGESQIWLVADKYTGLRDVRHWFTTHDFHRRQHKSYAGYIYLELWAK